jgi:integrase
MEGVSMAIQLYCQACKAYVPVTVKRCPKCGDGFSRENKKFRVDVTVKGKRVYRFVDNLTIAREVESAIKGDMVRDEFNIATHRVPEKPVTLTDVWEKYLPWAEEHKKSWRDDGYYYQKHLAPRFGSKALQDIQPLDIERMKLDLKKGVNARGVPYAAATIKHQIVLLRRLFNVARKWGMYEGANPVERVQMPKIDNQKNEFLTDDELVRLLEVLDNWPFSKPAAFVRFALLSGLRRGELFKLTWDAVDFERNLVTLVGPKGGKTTTIPISPEALEVLKPLDRAATFVFPGENGKKRTDFKGPWARIRKAAGLPDDFRFHGLRHNFASTLVSNGVDLGIVRELLSHKSVVTTQRYAHFAPDAVTAGAVKAGQLLTGRKKNTVLEMKK